MPTSIDPQPAENEFECANCGAYFHYELTRCPNCGVNLYEPEDETEAVSYSHPQERGMFDKLKDMLHRVFNKPYAADEVFGDALDQAVLYNDLLQKLGGDRAAVERLIDFERGRSPRATRMVWLKNAIRRWERDNRVNGSRWIGDWFCTNTSVMSLRYSARNRWYSSRTMGLSCEE